MTFRIDHALPKTVPQEFIADRLRIVTNVLLELDHDCDAGIDSELLLPLVDFGRQLLWVRLHNLFDRFGFLRTSGLNARSQLILTQVAWLLDLGWIDPLPLEIILTLVELFG